MPETNDLQLLREFAERQSEAAFAELVKRHVNLVYSVGLRQAGNQHHAEEITQAVFIILARKAGSLGRKTILSGWLYQTARLTAANFLRTERRRAAREQEAYMQSLSHESGPDVWPKIAPLLDDAVAKLGQKVREADVPVLKVRDFGKPKARSTKDGNPALDHGRLGSRIFDLQQTMLRDGRMAAGTKFFRRSAGSVNRPRAQRSAETPCHSRLHGLLSSVGGWRLQRDD